MKWTTRIYTLLLRLYPPDFHDEFGEEMTAVFTQALADAQRRGRVSMLIWCGREFASLLAMLIREQWRSWRREEAIMHPTNPVDHTFDTEHSKRETALAILAGIFPFILFGLMYVQKGIEYHNRNFAPNWDLATGTPYYTPFAWMGQGVYGSFIFLAFMLIGLGIGWARRFPRWSYAYLGVMVMESVMLANTATPGLRLFGHSFGREQWGWRGWLPLLALIVIMLLLTRSLRPLRHLLAGMWQDWTRLSFVLYGALTWLIMDASYDNKSWYDNTLYLPLNMLALALLFTGGAFFYMYCRQPWRRVVVLQLAIILYPPVSVAVEALDGNNFFISPDSVVAWLFIIMIWFGAMFMPGVLGLVHRVVRSNHFA